MPYCVLLRESEPKIIIHMNQKKIQKTDSNPLHMIALIVIGLLLATGGVGHAILKNYQVSVAREIDSTERRIEETNETMKMVQVKIDRKLNRHMIRADLANRDSLLVPIQSQDIEVVTNGTASFAKVSP